MHYEKFADGTVKCIEDEIPFELPEGWAWSRLNVVVDVRDGTHDTPAYVENGIPLITSKNLIEGGIDYSNVKYISEEDALIINERSGVNVGDILFAMIGTIGNPSMVTEDILISIKNVALFKFSFSDNLNNYYIMNYLDYAQENMKKSPSGGLQPFVSLNYLRTYLIPIPPVEEQVRIVSIVNAAIEKIRNIDTLNDELMTSVESVKNKILDLAIRGQLVPQNHDDEPASVLLERIRAEKEELIKQGKIKREKKESVIFRGEDNSYYDEIPDGWSEIALKDVCEVRNGYAFKSSDFSKNGTPIIRISDIQNETISIEDCVYWNQEVDKRFVIENGDLLIAMSGATTGKMGVYKSDFPAYLNQRVGNVRIKSDEILCAGYRDIYLRGMQNFILKNAYGGAQPNISSKFIEELHILLPPYNEQLRIVEKVKMLFHILNTIEKPL